MSLFLSRAALRRDAAVDALAPLLLPPGDGARVGAAHRLVWALFADGPDRTRDFLWREEAPGRFLMLSARAPVDAHGLFTLASKPFEPALAAGDRLGFRLRANATVAPANGPDTRRSDIVMHALRGVSRGKRGPVRLEQAASAGRTWLARQGAHYGFAIDDNVAVDGYEVVRVARVGAAPAVFGVLEIGGHLTVSEPACFLARLAQGFGRAKSFGCGLMLIRRAPR